MEYSNYGLSDLRSSGPVVLYQPNPTKQLLLYDMATSSSVLTFLKMHRYIVNIKNQTNTEFMSENGRLPVVIAEGSDKPMCGFKEVFRFVSRTFNYAPSLQELAYMDWIETKFLEAEMYVCWCYEPILNEYTKNRYTFDLPWPISSILFRQKRQEIQRSLGKRFNDFSDFLEKFNKFLDQLNKLVGNRPFCSNELNPSAINALVYGHANAILGTSLHPKLVEAIKWHKRIENFVQRIEEHYPS
jgi:hypothetical protein